VPGDHAEYSSVVVGELCGTKQYVQQLHDNVVGVNAKTGKLLWSYKKLGTTANIPTPILVGNDHVLACAGYGKGVALIKLTGSGDNIKAEEVYYKNKGCKHGGMIMIGDHVYLDEDSSGKPYCAKVMNGDIAWARQRGKTGCPGGGSASIAYADGNLYIRYESGHMALVEATPDGFKEKSWFKIPNDKNPSWAHPVVLGGKLYLRSQDQLMCYDVSAAK
jgi:outer membrane protein assembly factor BamB